MRQGPGTEQSDDKEEGLRLVVAVGKGVEDHPPEPVSSYTDTRAGHAFNTGEPIIDNENSPRRGRARTAYGSQSAAWLPVKAAGRIMGVLAVNSGELGYFTPQRIQLLTAIASGLGTFVENANLREAERLHVEELDRELQAAIKRSEMRLSEALLGEPRPHSSPSDRVLRYLDDHPEGAKFETLEQVAEISARGIVPIMAHLLDEGKVRQQFPLFLPVKQPTN